MKRLKKFTGLAINVFGTIVLLLAPVRVLADTASDPCNQAGSQQTISAQDCAAIIGNWTDWIPDNVSASCGGSDINLVGSDNKAKTWNFLISQGFTPDQAAGIFGNLDWESGGALDPKALEANGSGTPGFTGHGIVQWSWERWRTDYGTTHDEERVPNAARESDLTDFAPYPPVTSKLDSNSLLGYAESQGSDWYDLGTQLSFMMKEIQPGGNRGGVMAAIKASTTLEGAATIWFNQYEGPNDSTLPDRITRGQQALALYGSSSATSQPGSPGSTSDACAAAIDCSSFSTTGVSGADLSQLRQNVVCLAENELKTVWTPLPAIPRMQYLKYSDNVPEEWCADFVSWVYKQAGYPFTGGSSGGWRLPAVDQIHQIGLDGQNFHWHSSDSGYTPRPGDLVIHKGPGVSHVNMVVSVSGNTLTLIGGDQGPGPYGGNASASIVSEVPQQGFTGSNTIGYVSPDN